MRILIALLAILLPVSAHAQTLAQGQSAAECLQRAENYVPVAQRYEEGMIFRLEKCGFPTSYVMGTMHLDDASITPLYEEAVALMQATTQVGFEFVENAQSAQMAQQYLFLPPSQPAGLNTMLTPEEFQQLTAELQTRAGIPPQAANRLHPWAASVVLQFPAPTQDGIALDVRLQHAAMQLGKALFSLETPKEQYDVFASIPPDKQVDMLKDTLADLAAIDASNVRLLSAYVDRDLETMDAIAEESLEMMDDVELQTYMQDALIDARNKLMVRRMQPKLAAGPSMVAIGALHLMGSEKGILPLLEADGWRVYPQF